MAHVGKIFDKTPSGVILAKRRDTALDSCKELGHIMSEKYERRVTKYENSLTWRCSSCGHSMTMDFVDGKEKGGALIHKCRGKSWL